MYEPIRIFDPNRTLKDAASKLKALVNNENRERKVVVISIAGSSKQGKSLMLNFWIRYVVPVFFTISLVESTNPCEKWLIS